MVVNKNIVFDCVGTLASYDKLYEAIEKTLGDRLNKEGIKAPMLGHLWSEMASREYTYLSMSGRYTPGNKIYQAIFYRVLWACGIAEPRKFASDEDLTAILKGHRNMEMRPGAAECISKLREAGFTVWGLTMGDRDTVAGYFERAGIEMPMENLMSCDSTEIGKPDPRAYQPLLERLSRDGGKPWFAAAHQWDVSAARRTGYRGAYTTVYEGEALMDIFGDMDVVAETLPEMADKIIAMSS